jgi:hypothetical protein
MCVGTLDGEHERKRGVKNNIKMGLEGLECDDVD